MEYRKQGVFSNFGIIDGIVWLGGIICLIYLLCFVFSSPVLAETTGRVTVTWEHDPPTDLDRYEVRWNGDNSTIVNVPCGTLTWSDIATLDDGDNFVEVRAVDLCGQHSEWGKAAHHDPVPGSPSITILIFQRE